MRLIYNNRLVSFMSVSSVQTTAQHLTQANIIIFMSQEHYQHAKEHLGYQGTCYRIWDITDLDGILVGVDEPLEVDIALMKSTEHTFKQIWEKVDFFVEDLKRSIEC